MTRENDTHFHNISSEFEAFLQRKQQHEIQEVPKEFTEEITKPYDVSYHSKHFYNAFFRIF